MLRIIFFFITLISLGTIFSQNNIPKLCECINMNQDNMTAECEKIKQLWKEQFEASDKQTKSLMIQEYKDCQLLAKMEKNPSLCICVSIDPKLWNKDCIKIKKNWDKAYQNADGETQKDMKQEILDCNTSKAQVEPKKNKLEDVSEENFCDCMSFYGGRLALELDEKPNQKKIEQYDKINKSMKNRCLFAMKDINIGELEAIDRASRCSSLEKYFLDSTHIYSVQKSAADRIFQVLDKYENRIEVCSCIEMMKIEKQILNEYGNSISKRQHVQMVFEKPRQLCADLVKGLSDGELKEFEEKAKNCN